MPPPVLIGWRFPAGVPKFSARASQAAQPLPPVTGAGTYALSYVSRRLRIFGRAKRLPVVLPAAPQAVGAGTYALPYVSRRLRISRPRRVLGVFAAPLVIVEAQPHYLARFQPAKLTVWPFLNQWDRAQPPVIETNTHFIAKFTSPPAWRFAYNSWDRSQPAVTETQPHFLARYQPAKLTVWPFLSSLAVPPLTVAAAALVAKRPLRWRVQKRPLWRFFRPKHLFSAPLAETNPHFLAKFSPSKVIVWPGLRQHADIQPPIAETNTNFLAAFKPTRLTVSPLLYRQQTALDVPTAAPQAIGGGTYALPYVSHKLRIFGRPRHPFVKPAPVSTTTVTGAGFYPLLYFPRRSWIVNVSRYAIVPLQPETNPHYLARFRPTKLAVWPFLNSQDGSGQSAPPPPAAFTGGGFGLLLQFPRHSWIVNTARYTIVPLQPETNPSFLASFKPTKLTVWPFLNSQDQGGPSPPPPAKGAGTYALPYKSRRPRIFGRSKRVLVVPPPVAPSFATSTHSIGRFTPAKLLVSPLLYRQQPALDITVAAEAQPHFVARFRSQPAWRFNYNSWDQGQPSVAETQPHFLARFTPVKFVIWSGYRQHADFQPPAVETNVHTIGRFVAAKLFVSPLLRQHHPGDLNSIIVPPPVLRRQKLRYVSRRPRIFGRPRHLLGSFPPVVVETNPHYLATFKSSKLISFAYNSTDTGVPQQETQPHFIGRFRQVSTWRFSYNSFDTGVPQAETNPHFVARFNPAHLSWFRYNSTDTGVPQVETNPHYIARYAPARLSWFAYNSTDTAVPQVETNPHQIGRFTPAKLIRFGYNTRADDPPVAEANPHFVATFRPARVSQFGYNNRADDPPVVETNPHQIGSFRPTKITKLAALWNNPAADIYVSPVNERQGNPHFIGRFTPTKLISFRFNGTDTQVPPIPSIWMTSEARNLTATDAGRKLFATAEPRVRTSTWGN